MKIKTLLASASASLFLSACGGDAPPHEIVEKIVRADLEKEMEKLKFFASPEGVAELDRTTFKVTINACEEQGDKNTQKCKITVLGSLNGEETETVITPTFKKEFNEWRADGSVFTE